MKLFKKENDGTAPKYDAEPKILSYDSGHYVMPLRTIIKVWLVNKLILGQGGEEVLIEKQKEFEEKRRKQHDESHANHAPEGTTVNHIAVLLDGKVVEVIRANDNLADILLSEPQFVKFSVETDNVRVGHVYLNDRFITQDEVNLNNV